MFVYRKALAFGSNLIHANDCMLIRKIQSNTLMSIIKLKSTSVDLENVVFKPKFTKEEQEKILETLNTCDVDQLSRFSISKVRIKSLKSWQTKKGPFQTLSDILEVEGLGVNVLEKLCVKILSNNEDPDAKAIKKAPKNIIMPTLMFSEIQHIKTVVGLHIEPVGISWAKVCRKGNTLSDWGFQDFTALPKKVSPIDLFHMAVSVLNAIPSGDVYILEAPPTLQNQKQLITTYTQHLEFSSMLITLINTSKKHNASCEETSSENNAKYINKVYYLRHYLPARLFKTLVGNEQVSSVATVDKLLFPTEDYSLPCTPVSVSEKLVNHYISCTPANCHLLGQALLLTITFMDLCVYKNQDSLKIFVPTQRAKAADQLGLDTRLS